MKKIFAGCLALLSIGLYACKGDTKSSALTHAEYLQAEKSTTVTIEAYIQGKQEWWESDGVGVASFYLQDQDGGYFVYNLPCDKESYDKKLTIGKKIQVTGQKTDWAGEIEIDGLAAGAEATYTILKDKEYVAVPKDVTQDLGTDQLIASQNMAVEFKDMTVLAQSDGVSAFYYKWDNSGKAGDDLYISLTDGENILSACVESYLCDKDTEVYKAVEALQVGDKVDLQGFLYWYEGAQPHVTKVTKKGNIFAKAEGTNSHEEYVKAQNGDSLVIEAFIQAKQAWWENDGVGVASFYLQDNVGGYFAYNLPCTKAEYDNQLTIGKKVKITGAKTSWAGENEIDGLAPGAEATFEVLDDVYLAQPKDITNLLGDPALLALQNMYVKLQGLTVVAKDKDHVVYYKHNNAGVRGDDIYFDVSDGKNTYTFTVESYLCDENTDCYKAVEALKDGEKIDIEGLLYWYNGAQPHVTKVTKSA